MYGNYGRQEDLEVLQKKNVQLKDNVLLLRAGNISFAEQVTTHLIPSQASYHFFLLHLGTLIKTCFHDSDCFFRWIMVRRRGPLLC